MSGTVAVACVRAWVRLYTRGLPAEVREGRRDEIDDDVWCQIHEADVDGRSRGAVTGDLVVRMVLGMPADIGWSLAQRARRPVESPPERRSSMSDRTFGAWAIAGGLTDLVLMAFYVPVGYELWTGRIGAFILLGSLLGALAFVVAGLGLAWHHQDGIGPVGALGGAVVALGAIMSLNGSLVALPIGSALLAWDLRRIGVVGGREAAAQALAAVVVLIGVAILHPSLEGDLRDRALAIIPFVLSLLAWVALGASLMRNAARPEPAGTA